MRYTLLHVDGSTVGYAHLTWEERPFNIPRRAVRAALYYLAAQPTLVSREVLAFLFWADSPETMARHWDPQIAAIYYDQIVNKGKHHLQAICTCATHLLDRVLVVLCDDRYCRPVDEHIKDMTPLVHTLENGHSSRAA